MRCPIETEEHAETLLAYCANRLDPAQAAALERHMRSCAACRSFQEAQQTVWEALDTWEAPPVPADFDRRLYQRIEAEGYTWWQRLFQPFRPVLLRQGLPLAAAACLLVMAGIIAQRPGERRPAPAPPAVRVESVQAEQVERTLDDLELLHQFTEATGVEKHSPDSM
ncbi:MAG TPA: zf-HC2 domain-containing protein [Bryobacteraceae bacterium]|nr:zf-HC2 domain-containing protein [Bryobacteraceae bacterium]